MSKKTKSPDFTAYVVRKVGENSYWDRIGAAWNNQDGQGISIRLAAIPLNGEIVLRQPKSDEEGDA